MKLFSRLKDYNNLLEEILDTKTFSSLAKSLLLSMIYKLEISYKDYEKVKVDSLSKDDFFKNILEIIKKYCDNIKTVEPESIQATLLIENNVEAVTNSKERSILTYPTERALLYAICDIEPKYFFVKKDFILKNTLQRILVSGYKQNTMEILKDFNGWSWGINLNEKQDYIANMLYQNLMMIMGEEFLYEWRNDNKAKKDYLKELKNTVKKITGNDNYYKSFCRLLYLTANKKERKKIQSELEETEVEYKEILKQSDEIKKQNSKKIEQLQENLAILNNKKTEYEEMVELQKYFLEIIEKKINRLKLREEIIEIIYQLRYYQNIVFFEGVYIKDYTELKQALDNTLKLAITKACKMGVIKIISMDIETNFELIKYVLDTKIIDLEEIRIYLEFEEDNTIFIKVYDKQVFEKQGRKNFNGNKKDITIRKKRMIKLFN